MKRTKVEAVKAWGRCDNSGRLTGYAARTDSEVEPTARVRVVRESHYQALKMLESRVDHLQWVIELLKQKLAAARKGKGEA